VLAGEAARTGCEALAEAQQALWRAEFATAAAAVAAAKKALRVGDVQAGACARELEEADVLQAQIEAALRVVDVQAEAEELLDRALTLARRNGVRQYSGEDSGHVCWRMLAYADVC
jgi:nucleoid-associated protein YgaU